MDESVGPQRGGIEVSPEERRFLASFFRRQGWPYAAALALLSILSAWTLGGGADAEREARTAAAVAQLRSENQKLRQELVVISDGIAAGGAPAASGSSATDELAEQLAEARRSIRSLESRVAAPLDRRIQALERKLEQGAQPPASASAGPPPDASAWDVSSILDRLYALEQRQQQEVADWQAGARSRDARVGGLEQRLVQIERRLGSHPAAAAPAP